MALLEFLCNWRLTLGVLKLSFSLSLFLFVVQDASSDSQLPALVHAYMLQCFPIMSVMKFDKKLQY